MTDVLLVNCAADVGAGRMAVEHLGLSYLAAVLGERGIGARTLDASFHGLHQTFVIDSLLGLQPRLAGFTVYYNNVRETLATIAAVRERGFLGHITMGGHHATFNADAILADWPSVDSVVLGEGEGAVADLASALLDGRGWQDVANLAYRQGGAVAINPCRALIDDLDAMPFARREGYREHYRRQRMAAMVSSRGCFGRCTFCSIRSFYGMAGGRAWRSRSAHNVVDEIEYLQRQYGVERISFLDDEFIGVGRKGRERATEIGEEIARRRLQLRFNIICRPDNLDADVLSTLKSVGLECVDIGVESWTPRQLALYGKRVSPAQNRAAIATLERLGLQYRVYVMPIDPFVTASELRENLAEVDRVGLEHFHDGTFLARLVVFKGTALEDRLRREGWLRSPEGQDYLGFLDYEFGDPEIRRLRPALHRTAEGLKAANARIRAVFQDGQLNAEEAAFGVALKTAVNRAFLEMSRDLVATGKVEQGGDDLNSDIASICATLDAVERARREGWFARFAPCRFAVGGEVLEYPSAALRQVTATLTSSLFESD